MNKAIANKYIISVIAGVLSALMFASIQSGGFVGVLSIYLSAAPIATVGFAFGLPFTVLVGIIGMSFLIVISNFNLAFYFILIDTLPILLTVWLFHFGLNKSQDERQKQTENLNYGFILAAICVLMSFVMFVFTKTMVANYNAVAENNDVVSIQNMMYFFVEKMLQNAATELPIESDVVAKILVPFVPFLIVLMWFFHILIGLFASVWAVNKLGNNIRKKPEYKNMLLPYWLVVAMFFALVWGMVFSGDNGFLARNIAIILFIPFLLQGFTVVNAFANKTKFPKTILFFFYVFFAIGSYWVVLAIGVLGLIENFIKLHHKTVINNSEE